MGVGDLRRRPGALRGCSHRPDGGGLGGGCRRHRGEPLVPAARLARLGNPVRLARRRRRHPDRKSTRLNSSHITISYAVFCLKKKKTKKYVRVAEQKKKKKI